MARLITLKVFTKTLICIFKNTKSDSAALRTRLSKSLHTGRTDLTPPPPPHPPPKPPNKLPSRVWTCYSLFHGLFGRINWIQGDKGVLPSTPRAAFVLEILNSFWQTNSNYQLFSLSYSLICSKCYQVCTRKVRKVTKRG